MCVPFKYMAQSLNPSISESRSFLKFNDDAVRVLCVLRRESKVKYKANTKRDRYIYIFKLKILERLCSFETLMMNRDECPLFHQQHICCNKAPLMMNAGPIRLSKMLVSIFALILVDNRWWSTHQCIIVRNCFRWWEKLWCFWLV